MKLKDLKLQLLQNFQIDKIDLDLVICTVLNITRTKLFIYDDDITEQQIQKINKLVNKLNQGWPFAYITGVKDFWTLELIVNQHTLIPRPETELIVEKILDLTNKDFNGTILDLGTGSGAIALSIASERKHASIIATDFSEQCLKVAKKNCDKYQLHNVEFIKSNWYEELKSKKFNFIISNPPYVAEKDPHLENLKFEPITALTSKNNGMHDIQTIIKHAKNHLLDSAVVMIEHGYEQSELVKSEFQKNGFIDIELIKDHAGLPRITMAKFQNLAIDK
jgi:release factor glutamine methyltransferase